jgi:hypothetical protein
VKQQHVVKQDPADSKHQCLWRRAEVVCAACL